MERKRAYLKLRYRVICSYVGVLLLILGGLYLLPLLTVFFYPEHIDQMLGFLTCSAVLSAVGVGLRLLRPKEDTAPLMTQEGALILVAVWLLAIISGTIPFLFYTNLSFPQVFFESASGWTTTGLSVIDVTDTSPLLLMYRSFIQLLGGAGFAIITLSALTGPSAMGLMQAEGRTDKLEPHVRKTAVVVLRIYAGYIVGGTLLLRLAGMGWFDAINHAFTALSTGGFSTRPESIGYWDSPLVEAAVILLMMLGTINFLTAYLLIQRKVTLAFRNEELRFMGGLMLVGVTLIFGFVTLGLYPSLQQGVRVAIFEVVSTVTTTGFSTVGYADWGGIGWFVLILLMIIGGGAGSTAGGLKKIRIYILLKTAFWEVRRALRSQSVVNMPTLTYGNDRRVLSDEQVRTTAAFVTLYMLCLCLIVLVMLASGYSLPDGLFEAASTLSTVGLSVGVTSVTMPIHLYWVMSAGMLLGRLEFIYVFVGLAKLGVDIPYLFRLTD